MDEKGTPSDSPAEFLPPPRKRQISGDDDDEPKTKRARLTRKNLALFDEMGKTKESTKDSTSDSKSSRSLSTTAPGFAVKARDNGILGPMSSKPPTNLEDLHKRHARSRASVSPTKSEYAAYTRKVSKAKNEATMVLVTSQHLLKDYDDDRYTQTFNQQFTGYPKNQGFNDGLSAPQPDFVEGLEEEEFRPFPVGREIEGAAIYEDDPDSIVLPHIAGEWKKRGGDMDNAQIQSAYDGAALVHARNKALEYMGKPDPPNHANITTFTTDGNNVNHYAHYAAPSEDDPTLLEYHQYQYASTSLKDTYEGHKIGRKGLRNAQDHAKAQSYKLKDQLKKHWKEKRTKPENTTPSPAPSYIADEPEAYETEEATYEVVEQPMLAAEPMQPKSHSTKSSHASDSQKRKASTSPPSTQHSMHSLFGPAKWVTEETGHGEAWNN